MKIEKARAAAMLMFLLHKFKILNSSRYDRMIDYISVRTLKTQMEDVNAKLSENEGR